MFGTAAPSRLEKAGAAPERKWLPTTKLTVSGHMTREGHFEERGLPAGAARACFYGLAMKLLALAECDGANGQTMKGPMARCRREPMAFEVKSAIGAPSMHLVAAIALIGCCSPHAAGQSSLAAPVANEPTGFDFAKTRSFGAFTIPSLSRPQLGNSARLHDLISGGKLTLTLDDAIALALENNLEIAVIRYDLPIAQTDLLRAEGRTRKTRPFGTSTRHGKG